MALATWLASSRVGTIMTARGWQGRLLLPASLASAGMPKARVLPDPVWARPSTSWPAIPSGITASWTGVGVTIPCRRRASISSAGRPVNALLTVSVGSFTVSVSVDSISTSKVSVVSNSGADMRRHNFRFASGASGAGPRARIR